MTSRDGATAETAAGHPGPRRRASRAASTTRPVPRSSPRSVAQGGVAGVHQLAEGGVVAGLWAPTASSVRAISPTTWRWGFSGSPAIRPSWRPGPTRGVRVAQCLHAERRPALGLVALPPPQRVAAVADGVLDLRVGHQQHQAGVVEGHLRVCRCGSPAAGRARPGRGWRWTGP